MYARVTRFQMDTNRRNEAAEISDSRIAPALRDTPGFKRMDVLVDPGDGDGLVVTYWESRAAEVASRESVSRHFGTLGAILTAPPEPSRAFELVAGA